MHILMKLRIVAIPVAYWSHPSLCQTFVSDDLHVGGMWLFAWWPVSW